MIYQILRTIFEIFAAFKYSAIDMWQQQGCKPTPDGIDFDPSNMVLTSDGTLSILATMIGVAFGAYLIYYLFRSFGLYKMAKRRGFKNPKLCFVPFYALFMASKLRSECVAFSKHKPYPIVAVSAIGLFVLCSLVLDAVFSIGIIAEMVSVGYIDEYMFEGSYAFADALTAVMDVAKVVYVVVNAMIFYDLFRTYSPFNAKTHMLLSVVLHVLFAPVLYGVFVLALSNRSAVNYDEILEKRRIYFGYGSPYGGYGPYGRGGENGSRRNEDEPFSDFSNSKSDDPFSDFSDSKSNDDPFSDF